MKQEVGDFCPLIKESCVKWKCSWFIKIRGVDPNTGEELDDWNCAISWAPMLLINAADQARKGAAATESFRNEMVKQNEVTNALLEISQGGQPLKILAGGNKLDVPSVI